MKRLQFLLWMTLAGAFLTTFDVQAAPGQGQPDAPGITGVFFDVARIHHDTLSQGDTWDYAWADDDSIYSFADDSRGYAQGPDSEFKKNMNFNRLTGSAWDGLAGSSVNLMSDYGRASQEFPNGATWKTTGCDCIDGVLYAFVAPNWYGGDSAYGIGPPDPYLRQTACNMSLIKSTDHGRTWTRSESENYDHPMWNSYKFSTAYFFKFGKNGGDTPQDDQDKFVYALSNDGYWNDGTGFFLGRVPRRRIGSLQAADWQFYAGGWWTSNVDDATPIAGFPNGQVKCASGSPLWLAPLRKYVTVTWYNPQPADTRRWDLPEDRIFEIYQSDHPWGPWASVGQKKSSEFISDPDTLGKNCWYGPSLCAKFVTQNPDKSVTAIMTFAGTTDTPMNSLYSNNSLPVTFYVTPQPRLLQWLNDTDQSIRYSEGWTYEAHYGQGDYHDDEHRSVVPGSSAEITFTGSGFELLSSKSSDQGEIEVLLDGVPQGRLTERQNPFPRLYRIPVYRNMTLDYGTHKVRIVNHAPAGTVVNLDGYKTYGNGGAATTPPAVAGLDYEAEAGAYGSSQVYQDGAASHGAAVQKLDIQPGSGVRFSHVSAGSHLLIRYCTDYDPGTLTLYVNGTKSRQITFPRTGGWSGHYETITVPVDIPAGAELKLQCDPGDAAANIDGISINGD